MSEKREIIVVVRGEGCDCVLDGLEFRLWTDEYGDHMNYPCDHGSVARAATAADHAEALGLSAEDLFVGEEGDEYDNLSERQYDEWLESGGRSRFGEAARLVREAQEKRGAQ